MRSNRFCVAVFAFGIFCSLDLNGVSANNGEIAKIKEPELAQQLRARVDADQAARKEWVEFGTSHKAFGVDLAELDPLIAEQFTSLTNRMEGEDKKNRIWLKDVIQKHGWPGKSLVGTDGAKNAWLLVQHADQDRDFQRACLKKMEELPQGDVSPKDLAYLTDRILSGTSQKQKYGTQAFLENGKVTLYPIDDEEHVDERRKAMGLGTLAESLAQLEKQYGVSKPPEPANGNKAP